MLEYRDNIKQIKGVGDKTAALFSKIGINNVGNLLHHYPFRYESYAYPMPISSCMNNQLVSIEGIIVSSPKMYNAGRYKIIEVLVKDDTGTMTLKWFNTPFMRNVLKFGERLIFRGKVQEKYGRKSITQAEYFTKEKYAKMIKSLRPVYSTTEGLTQNAITTAISKALNETLICDYIPGKLRQQYDFPGIKETISDIHFPENEETLTKALSRLVFEEFFFFLLNIRRLKENTELIENKHVIVIDERLKQLENTLGYELTDDQKKAVKEILEDMNSKGAMQRLLQGDVGSGKTVVALLAMAAVAFNNKQSCIMAPTEVLASQHFEYFKDVLEPFGIEVEYLSGSMTKKQKIEAYERIKIGESLIVVGTHAAIQDNVSFKELALCVIDEQHRFGVKQREAISLKGDNPHLLLMSATPIPRTYALMLYGDMDISVLEHLPANRKPIKNCVADESMREMINRFILKEINQGHQAYVICPLVEESDKVTAAAVGSYVEELRETLGGGITVSALHGKMKAAEKNEIMERFVKGEIHVLVSTTVIEVGINNPNATLMVIENAENFGLAQLHQIRGRVGRGSEQSYCIFVAGKKTDAIKERLDIVAGSNDGFYIASQDMKLRGPGDFFGVRQSGDQQFALADPLRDGLVLSWAKEAVEGLSDEEAASVLDKRNSLVSTVEYMVY